MIPTEFPIAAPVVASLVVSVACSLPSLLKPTATFPPKLPKTALFSLACSFAVLTLILTLAILELVA